MNTKSTDLVIHVGQHKTGSKSLQAFLTTHQEYLRGQGYDYPLDDPVDHGILAYKRSQYRCFALLRHEVMQLGKDSLSASWWQSVRQYCQPHQNTWGYFANLKARQKKRKCSTTLLSAEDLFDMHTAHELLFDPERIRMATQLLAWLCREFSLKPRIIVYLRRQDHLLAAHYCQYIKGNSNTDLDLKTFMTHFLPRLDTYQILTCWTAAFGTRQVIVRPYENLLKKQGIVDDFLAAANIRKPANPLPLPQDAEAVNRSPDRDLIEYLRILNRQPDSPSKFSIKHRLLESVVSRTDEEMHARGIAAWLSPLERRQLLDQFASGNGQIAREYSPSMGTSFFQEPLPEDTGWLPYSGLAPETISRIETTIGIEGAGRRP